MVSKFVFWMLITYLILLRHLKKILEKIHVRLADLSHNLIPLYPLNLLRK